MEWAWRDVIGQYCQSCIVPISKGIDYVNGFDVKDWAAVIGILWVVFQLNERRRLTDGSIEKYLDQHLDEKERNHLQERATYLPKFIDRADEIPLVNFLRVATANILRIIFLLLRMILLGRLQPPMMRGIALLNSGDKSGAKQYFLDWADDLLRKANLYEKQAKAKRLEAVSSFIYAGRVASLLDDQVGTIEALNTALQWRKDDPDAKKYVGLHFLAMGNPKGALPYFKEIVANAEGKEDWRRAAEGYRLEADAQREIGKPGNERSALLSSLRLETSNNNSLGIAETQEHLGNLYARKQGTRNAAIIAYQSSISNYRIVGDYQPSVKRVQKELDKLLAEETWLSQLLQQFGEFILRLAMRLRARPQRT